MSWPYKRAALAIGYDNGMINRANPQDCYLVSVADELVINFTPDELAKAEAVVAGFSDEELDRVCCGEQGVDWPASIQVGDNTDNVLNAIFGEV